MTRQIPLDLVFPATVAVWMTALWGLMARRAGLAGRWLRWAPVPPALTAGFDYAENAAIAALLLAYPDLDPSLVGLASGFTIVKSILSTVCFTALLVLAVRLAVRRARRPFSDPARP